MIRRAILAVAFLAIAIPAAAQTMPSTTDYPGTTATRAIVAGRSYVWNGSTWVPMTQPGSGSGGLTNTELRASPVIVTVSSGAVAVSSVAGTVAVSGPLTDAQLRASAVPVSGTFFQATQPVSGTFWQATQPVSGTFWQATQPISGAVSVSGTVPVSGPLTDTQIRASALPVSGTVTATGPLTDTQLRASRVPVDGSGVTQPVSGTVTATGPLTDTQLRATPVPISGTVSATVSGSVTATGPLTDSQLRATPVPVSGTVTASGPVTDTQLRASPVPVSGPLTDTQIRATALPVSGTVTASGPVTDTQLRATPVPISGTVTASGPLTDTQLRASAVPVSSAGLTNLDVALSTRLKPADTLTGVTTVGTVTTVTNPVTVTPPTLTKGTQAATGFSVQHLHDAGRNQTNYFMAAPVALTNAEALQSLTGYKSGAAVGATTTPAVVTSGKTYRITRITVSVFASTAIGSVRVFLHANLSGAGGTGSPLVDSWQFGIPAVFTASAAFTYNLDFPEGIEFAAGTGIAVGAQGFGAPTTAAANDFVMISVEGYEY